MAVNTEALTKIIVTALEDTKGKDINVINVANITSLTDVMVFCSGTSTRHVKSLADNVATKCKEHGIPTIGTEGEQEGEWVLVDLGDAIVHVMLPATRDLYQLEKLWGFDPDSEKDERQVHES